MLDKIEDILRRDSLVSDDWAQEMKARADNVALFRRYYDGDHDVKLDENMQDIVRSNLGFSDNYIEMVANTMIDRLIVRSVACDDEGVQAWGDDLLKDNRFDELQLDVHESVITDGDAYLLMEYSEEKQRVVINYEPAYDGREGMMVVYDRRGREIVAAVKIWVEVDTTRVNFYYPDRVEKYISYTDEDTDLSDIRPLEGNPVEPWLAGAVPVMHFKHKATRRRRFGKSEIKSAISLNDALNRTVTSTVVTAELTAFRMMVAVGFDPGEAVGPAAIFKISPDRPLAPDENVEMYTLEPGEVSHLIEAAAFLIDQIGTVTLTPLPSLTGGDTQSGEALKERKAGLVGKVKRAQVRLGNTWEDAMRLAATIHNTYNTTQVAMDVRWNTRWQDAEMRDDSSARENAKLMREAGYEREFLRIMGKPLDYDEAKIKDLVEERDQREAAALAALGGSVPGFDQFALN